MLSYGANVQVVMAFKSAGPQLVVGVATIAMMASAQRDGGGIRRLLSNSVRSGVRRFNTSQSSTDKARQSSDPREVSWIPTWFHFSLLTQESNCEQFWLGY